MIAFVLVCLLFTRISQFVNYICTNIMRVCETIPFESSKLPHVKLLRVVILHNAVNLSLLF